MAMLHYTGHLSENEIQQMRCRERRSLWLLVLIASLVAALVCTALGQDAPQERRARIKDISSIEGILLNDADFKSAGAMADAINAELGRPAARAYDSRRVELSVTHGEDVPQLLSRVEGIEVPVFPRARVIVNERTGTGVIGGKVVLQPVSILHGGLAVNVVTEFKVSQPQPYSGGSTQVIPQTRLEATDKPVSRIELKQGATVDDLVRSLQTIGASARDVISILQAMKAAGALEAEIEVL